MKGWLNYNRQKGLFDEIPECPGCGCHDEKTQLHIFQCNNSNTKKNRAVAFKLTEKYCHKYQIPGMVYVPFIRMCKSACPMSALTWKDLSHALVQKAIDNQSTLDVASILSEDK